MKQDLFEEISIPEGVSVSSVGGVLKVKGPKGELTRPFTKMQVLVEGSSLKCSYLKATRREKTLFYTFLAHFKNMFYGVVHGFTYRLKICSGHFPMNVSVVNGEVVVKNFLGENKPRSLTISQVVSVKVEGDVVVVESADKEAAGNVASGLEILTKVQNRDRRIFQDGIYIIEKGVRA